MKDSDRSEMKAASLKHFRDNINPVSAGHVKSIKVLGNWDRDGLLDKSKMTYHSAPVPSNGNVMGPPVTFHRPLTLDLLGVPMKHKESIEQAVGPMKGWLLTQAIRLAEPIMGPYAVGTILTHLGRCTDKLWRQWKRCQKLREAESTRARIMSTRLVYRMLGHHNVITVQVTLQLQART